MTQAESPAEKGERIAKVIARAGVCSRRDAEKMIAEGRVALGGKKVTTPATFVEPGAVIAIDGVPIPEKEKSLAYFHEKVCQEVDVATL